MPLVTSQGYNLVPDVSPLAQTIAGVVQGRKEEAKAAEVEQKALLRERLQTTGAMFLDVRGMTDGAKTPEQRNIAFQKQRAAIARMGQEAFKRGEDIGVYDDALAIETPDQLNGYLTRVITRAGDAGKKLDEHMEQEIGGGDGFTLSQGQKRYDAAGKLIASVEAEEDEPEQFVTLTDDEGNIVGQRSTKTGKVISDPRAKPEGSAVDAAKVEAGLRKEFTGLSKDFIKVRDAHTRVLKSAQNPTAAGDLAMIFNFMKVLDPGSVVRESEFATAEGARAAIGNIEEEGGLVPNVVKQGVQRLVEGVRMLPEQRADFLSRSQALYEGQLSNQEEIEKRFTDISNRNSVNPENVVITFRMGDTGGSATREDTPPPLTAEEKAELARRRELKAQGGN